MTGHSWYLGMAGSFLVICQSMVLAFFSSAPADKTAEGTLVAYAYLWATISYGGSAAGSFITDVNGSRRIGALYIFAMLSIFATMPMWQKSRRRIGRRESARIKRGEFGRGAKDERGGEKERSDEALLKSRRLASLTTPGQGCVH